MSDAPEDAKWPREIYAAELPDGDYPIGSDYVLHPASTVPRWEGDTEREREFQRYVDGDIYDSAEKYWKNRADIAEARIAELEARPVKVKPLEWRDSYGVLRADTEFGSYLISASGKILTLGVAPMSPQMVCANLDDAKAAAQADYERRIKDALETPDDQ